MNIQKEINSILEKFIIHLYDDFDFEEAKLKIECELKIQSELKDYYYTEEELYDMYQHDKYNQKQKDEKTGHVMEEVILYSFLGVFIIFIVDCKL